MSSDKIEKEKLDILRQEIEKGFSGEFRDFDIERIKRALCDNPDLSPREVREILRANEEADRGEVEEYPLDDLLDQVTPDNTHPETDFGKPVGKEWGSDDSDIS